MLSAEAAAKLNTARNNQMSAIEQLRALALEKERALAAFAHKEALLGSQLESQRAEIAGILGRTATIQDSGSTEVVATGTNILPIRPEPASELLSVSLAMAQ